MRVPLGTIPVRFCPSKETLAVLNGREWICSFSGGKDSTALVTWIEWLRRVGMVKCQSPRLVMSDTGVEFPFLRGIADRVMAALAAAGWACEVVTPPVSQRLYCMIFGRGVTPVHPGDRKMRWCTRATKIDPMTRYARGLTGDMLQLSGVRWGESDVRDGKLRTAGCAAGGECGLPDPGPGVYGPIITWRTCQVIEWLSGKAGDGIADSLADMSPAMLELVGVYEVKTEQAGMFPDIPPKLSALRFGCIGCPAIGTEKVTRSKRQRDNPAWQHLGRIYDIWQALYLRRNRCCRIRAKDGQRYGKKFKAGYVGYGPLKMEARQRYFAELMQVQADSGVTLVTPDDVAFIRDCWARKVYPRGWSEADEAVQPPDEGLFAEAAR